MQLTDFLVPTARLELAQLSPLPPQDSVSTNFTTSAALEFLASARMRMARRATANSSGAIDLYFCGMAPAPEAVADAAGAGGGAITAALAAPGFAPGMAPAPEAVGAGAVRGVAGRSRTLVAASFGRSNEV